MILLSYLGSHWLLFIGVLLAIVGLGAAAWFLKNWKFALAAIVVAVLGIAYQSANMEGYKRRVNEEAQAQIVLLQKRLLSMAMITQADNQRATADAYLNTKLDALSRETPYNASACLPVDATRRVRAIGSGQADAAPVSARRHSKLFP